MGVSVKRGRHNWHAVYKTTEKELSATTPISCAGGANRRKALEWAQAWASQLTPAQTEPSELVTDYALRFVRTKAALGEIELSTLRGYVGMLHRYVNPCFDGLTLNEVTPHHVEQFLLYMSQELQVSGSTSKKAYNLVASVFQHAVNARQLDWSPFTATKAPKSKATTANPLTEQSRLVLLQRIDELQPSPYTLAVLLSLYTGMRRGEVCGLRWHNVNIEQQYAIVNEAVSQREGGTYLKDTKTHIERQVPLTDSLTAALKERRTVMLEQCMSAGISFSGNMFVVGEIDGRYLSPALLTRWWNLHRVEWGLIGTQGRLPVFHDLRHTFATVAVRSIDMRTAQSIMGHSAIDMTMRYADTSHEQLMGTLPVLERALASKVESSELRGVMRDAL